jgi:hypothetical protein
MRWPKRRLRSDTRIQAQRLSSCDRIDIIFSVVRILEIHTGAHERGPNDEAVRRAHNAVGGVEKDKRPMLMGVR